ncbi:hypothetical protein EVAR_33567_1 [Eumeta japonica]|uniref:Uncharacterized protein n=1 Tax=Eumeta variegata TaxID=151549 RepID=A0A4C1VIN0_EUMVA|nr:hypothetical protein EVAR_33567_1 [Eumeta japonica]
MRKRGFLSGQRVYEPPKSKGYRRPWILATLEKSPVHCQPPEADAPPTNCSEISASVANLVRSLAPNGCPSAPVPSTLCLYHFSLLCFSMQIAAPAAPRDPLAQPIERNGKPQTGLKPPVLEGAPSRRQALPRHTLRYPIPILRPPYVSTVLLGRELNIKSLERVARRPYIGYGSFVWNIGVCGACEADGGRGCPTWPVIQRASLNASLFGSSGHLGASLQRSRGRTSFVLDVLHTAVFTSWKVAGMYSVSMIHVLDYS